MAVKLFTGKKTARNIEKLSILAYSDVLWTGLSLAGLSHVVPEGG